MSRRPACALDGCAADSRARGLCATHYSYWRRGRLPRQPGYPQRPIPATVYLADEWPFEVQKVDGVWCRRPTGSNNRWAPVPGFLEPAGG